MKPIIKVLSDNLLQIRRIRNNVFLYASNGLPTIYCYSKTYQKHICRLLRTKGIKYSIKYNSDGRRAHKIELEARLFCNIKDCLDYFYIEKCSDWDIDILYKNNS